MSNDPTTGRARRQRAVSNGTRSDGVDRLSRGSNPGGSAAEGTSRMRQQRLAREVASETEIDRDGVGTVDRIGGMDVFLRSEGTDQFASNLRNQFASEADFVEANDVAANVDPQTISAAPEVARNRRDDVAARAREQTAADAQFIESGDLQADVGARGVRGIEIASDRRDDVADRTRRGLAADDPFAEPGDFSAEVSASGIEQAGLTDMGARNRATRQFESEIDLFGSGELDPNTDIRETDGGGFALGEDPARELAAAELSDQVDGTVAPSEITLEAGDDGAFDAVFERGGR